MVSAPVRRSAPVFAWAVAEATCWPVMPDAILVPLAAARPRDWRQLALAAAAGSSAGGIASYALGRAGTGRSLLTRLPLVRPSMVRATECWLADDGSLGVRHQPLSGVPFKVFALLAGARGLPLGPFLGAAFAVRGARFLAVGGMAALLGHRFGRAARRHRPLLLALWSVAFAVGLQRTVVAWERRTIMSAR